MAKRPGRAGLARTLTASESGVDRAAALSPVSGAANARSADAAAGVTDDLSDVLDNASIDEAAIDGSTKQGRLQPTRTRASGDAMAGVSTMMPLGNALPSFSLPGLDGRVAPNDDFAGGPLLVAFLCNHCPDVRHIERDWPRIGRARRAGIGALHAADLGRMYEQAMAAAWAARR